MRQIAIPSNNQKNHVELGSNCYMPMYLNSLLPIETPQTLLEKAKDQPSQTHECGQHLKPKVFKIEFKLIMRDTHHPVTKFWPPPVYTCKLQIWKLKISHTSIIKLYNYFLLSIEFPHPYFHLNLEKNSLIAPTWEPQFYNRWIFSILLKWRDFSSYPFII